MEEVAIRGLSSTLSSSIFSVFIGICYFSLRYRANDFLGSSLLGATSMLVLTLFFEAIPMLVMLERGGTLSILLLTPPPIFDDVGFMTELLEVDLVAVVGFK